jgi:hypothetical protein
MGLEETGLIVTVSRAVRCGAYTLAVAKTGF